MPAVTSAEVKALFATDSVVSHYAAAAVDIGLWRSEEAVFTQNFRPENTLLEVGCGAGRIAIGLWELGYQQLLATDFSRPMVEAARSLTRKLDYSVPVRVADATDLKFENDMFDGAIFGFNGLMQIPGRENRRQALAELRRVVRPSGRLVFTTHDRGQGGSPDFWEAEAKRWANEEQDPVLVDFGDRMTDSDHGKIFIHIPTRDEVAEDIEHAGWTLISSRWRSDIAEEPPEVEDFSVDCRFWVVEKALAETT